MKSKMSSCLSFLAAYAHWSVLLFVNSRSVCAYAARDGWLVGSLFTPPHPPSLSKMSEICAYAATFAAQQQTRLLICRISSSDVDQQGRNIVLFYAVCTHVSR